MTKENNVSKTMPLYILPSDNDELESFILKYKSDMFEQIINCFEIAINNDLPVVELFQFKNSDFAITSSPKEFEKNLEHIYNICLTEENYELCSKIIKLQKLLKNKTINEK